MRCWSVAIVPSVSFLVKPTVEKFVHHCQLRGIPSCEAQKWRSPTERTRSISDALENGGGGSTWLKRSSSDRPSGTAAVAQAHCGSRVYVAVAGTPSYGTTIGSSLSSDVGWGVKGSAPASRGGAAAGEPVTPRCQPRRDC